ncbi:hypothetical protein [Jannaschia formosa]|uniref:hypothetical protein n=1 Tax=Jannaschia formosa TaxID=2259592 RepID=UPI000E1BE498|nr:hypothetical protein [Jannaschia formosa]TFL16443.1 hypothetical protein DR046_20190 [Jannaschia formosa]
MDTFLAAFPTLRTDVNALAAYLEDLTGGVTLKAFGAVGDGTTDDSAAIAAAHAEGAPVDYRALSYNGDESTGYFSVYGATKYKAASASRLQYGLASDPVDDPEPIQAVVKFSDASRAVDTAAWDQTGYYGLIKVSGDAYATALTGYARAQAGSGDIIGVHGRARLDTANAGRGYAGWFYAEVFGTKTAAHALELNMWHDTDPGHSATGGKSQGIRIAPADSTSAANRMSSAISIGPSTTGGTDNGSWTGIWIEPGSIVRSAGVTDDGEAMLINSPKVSTGSIGGIRFQQQAGDAGVFKYALRTDEATFSSNNVLLMGTGQKIRWGNSSTGVALTGGATSLAVENGVVNIADPDGTAALQVAGTNVLGPRKTGWTAATGTATRTTFATSTVTTAQLAERLKALLDDLTTHGLIGA